jgi:hypothetical protein
LGIQTDFNLVLKFFHDIAVERGQMGILGSGANLFGLVDNVERESVVCTKQTLRSH